MIRIPLVEDDNERVRRIKDWLPADVRLVHAGSADRAIGILERDRNVYAGIMLHHDLQDQIATDLDFFLSGTNVTKVIMANISPDVQIMVHSVNQAAAPRMVKALSKAGVSVTRLSMTEISEEKLGEWLDGVRECWDDQDG